MKEIFTLEEAIAYLKRNPSAVFTTSDSKEIAHTAKLSDDNNLCISSSNRKYTYTAKIPAHLKWKLQTELKPVPFEEAVEAFYREKTISCKLIIGNNLSIYVYKPCGINIELKDHEGKAVSAMEILKGVWYIGDASNE